MGVGITHGVSEDIPQEDLKTAIWTIASVKSVRRLGESGTVKLVFNTSTTTAFVRIGYTRFCSAEVYASPLSVPNVAVLRTLVALVPGLRVPSVVTRTTILVALPNIPPARIVVNATRQQQNCSRHKMEKYMYQYRASNSFD